MKQCSSPARAARLLDAFSRFEEWCDAFTIDNEPHTALEFVANVRELTSEWEHQQFAKLLDHIRQYDWFRHWSDCMLAR